MAARAARCTTSLTIHLTVDVVVVAAGLARCTASLTRGTASLTRSTAALARAAPGTTELLIIGVVEGDRRVNAAGPGCVSIAAR